MSLVFSEIILNLSWSENCVIFSGKTEKTKFEITNTKLYVPVVVLSGEDNIKRFKQLEFGFERTINWNKYQSEDENKEQNRHFNYLINPSFQRVNRLFVLLFENSTDWKLHKILYSKNRNKRLQYYY